MSLFRKKEIKANDVKSCAGMEPLKDEILIYLWQQAISGNIPVYFAAVPMNLIVPYDTEYKPAEHPIGRHLIKTIFDEWRKGQVRTVWVYPDGEKYTLSDDYVTYYAALEGKPDFLPCWILGKCNDDRLKDVQGPIAVKDIKKLIFEGFTRDE